MLEDDAMQVDDTPSIPHDTEGNAETTSTKAASPTSNGRPRARPKSLFWSTPRQHSPSKSARPASPTKLKAHPWSDALPSPMAAPPCQPIEIKFPPPSSRSSSPTKSSGSSEGPWRPRRRASSPTKFDEPWSFNRPDSPTKSPWFTDAPSSPMKSGSFVFPTPFNESLPKRRTRPPSLRLTDNPLAINPAHLIGRTLCKVHRGEIHPNLTLVFDDNTSVQVRVDGYDPQSRGLPKVLEMDLSLDHALQSSSEINLAITDCTLVRLTDKAFEEKDDRGAARWDQDHVGVAFKFAGMDGWHCVWAAKVDELQNCKFRSYEDVFLSPVERSPRRRHSRRQSMQRSMSDPKLMDAFD